MEQQVTIESITANTPVDIYYCYSDNTSCIYVTTVNVFPFTFIVPSPYSDENSFLIKIIDSQGCEDSKLITLTQNPTLNDIFYVNNSLDTVGFYIPTNNTISELFSLPSPQNYQDIGVTNNKIFLNITSGSDTTLYEYDITLNPWSVTTTPTTYTFNGISGNGLCTISDDVVAIAGSSVWTANTSTSTSGLLFNLPTSCFTTGDIIYNSNNDQYIISYTEEGFDDNYYYVAVFDSSGNIVSNVIDMGSLTTIFGLYTYNNNVFAVSSNFTMYQLDFENGTYGTGFQPSNVGGNTQIGMSNINSQVSWII